MSTDDTPGDSHTAMWAALCIILIPLIYILSIGPVLAIASKAGISLDVFEGFYTPVIWLHNHTPLEKPLEEYVKWWGIDP